MIETRRIENIFINNGEKKSLIIDVAISADQNIFLKEQEKEDKYQDFE